MAFSGFAESPDGANVACARPSPDRKHLLIIIPRHGKRLQSASPQDREKAFPTGNLSIISQCSGSFEICRELKLEKKSAKREFNRVTVS